MEFNINNIAQVMALEVEQFLTPITMLTLVPVSVVVQIARIYIVATDILDNV